MTNDEEVKALGEDVGVPAMERIWEMLALVESVNPPATDRERFGDRTFTAPGRWQVVIFYDCGELDYIDSFITPEGEEIDFWDWPECEQKKILMSWRGTGDLKRLKKLGVDWFRPEID